MNNKALYSYPYFRSPALDTLESINRALEPIRQSQAMCQMINQMGGSALSSIKSMNTAIESLKQYDNIPFNMMSLNALDFTIASKTMMVHTAFDSLRKNAESLGLSLSYNRLFEINNMTIMATHLSSAMNSYRNMISSEDLFLTENTNTIEDHELKQKMLDEINSNEALKIDNKIQSKILQIIYSPKMIDIEKLIDISLILSSNFNDKFDIGLLDNTCDALSLLSLIIKVFLLLNP